MFMIIPKHKKRRAVECSEINRNILTAGSGKADVENKIGRAVVVPDLRYVRNRNCRRAVVVSNG